MKCVKNKNYSLPTVAISRNLAQWFLAHAAELFYFFKNALNKSIGSGRNVVVLCSLAISRMVWR